MIRYSLVCRSGHEFEGWFKSSTAFEEQKEAQKLQCAVCGSNHVTKALMAPSVRSSDRSKQVETKEAPRTPVTNEAVETIRKLRQHIEKNADYVGGRFAEEARKIHYEEIEPRGIYGEATSTEIKDLAEEGVPFTPLPTLPEDHN